MFAVLQYSEWADRVEVLDKADQWLDTWFPQPLGRLERWMGLRVAHAYQLTHMGCSFHADEACVLMARLGFWEEATSDILREHSHIVDVWPAVQEVVEQFLRRDPAGIVISYCQF